MGMACLYFMAAAMKVEYPTSRPRGLHKAPGDSKPKWEYVREVYLLDPKAKVVDIYNQALANFKTVHQT
jgi:hypothetical protein